MQSNKDGSLFEGRGGRKGGQGRYNTGRKVEETSSNDLYSMP